MNIRQARVNDIISIEEISSSLGYNNPSPEIAQKRLQAVINSTSDKIWVAENKGQLIGWLHAFLALRVASPQFIEIGGVSVLPEFQKQGTGRELILQAQNWAKVTELALRVRCNSTRNETHEIYKSLGFLETKEQYVFELKA